MSVNLFIKCYSDHQLLESTMNYYSHKIPGVKITIYFYSDKHLLDNTSDDFLVVSCDKELSSAEIKRMINGINNQWVLIVNVNELLNINNTDFIKELRDGVNVIKTNSSTIECYYQKNNNRLLKNKLSYKRYISTKNILTSIDIEINSHELNNDLESEKSITESEEPEEQVVELEEPESELGCKCGSEEQCKPEPEDQCKCKPEPEVEEQEDQSEKPESESEPEVESESEEEPELESKIKNEITLNIDI